MWLFCSQSSSVLLMISQHSQGKGFKTHQNMHSGMGKEVFLSPLRANGEVVIPFSFLTICFEMFAFFRWESFWIFVFLCSSPLKSVIGHSWNSWRAWGLSTEKQTCKVRLSIFYFPLLHFDFFFFFHDTQLKFSYSELSVIKTTHRKNIGSGRKKNLNYFKPEKLLILFQ